MQATLTTLVFIGGTVLAALLATLGMAGAVHISSRRQQGFMHYIFYAMLLTVAATSLLVGRDLTSHFSAVESFTPASRHPIIELIQPLVSLLILAVCGERLITHWLLRDKSQSPPLLLLALVTFWLTTVALPALFGAHPKISHDYAYALVIGLAAAMATSQERDEALQAARNAILLFMLGSLLLVPVLPTMVMDLSYRQGLLPGLPRLAGLAPHPVSLGQLAQLGLICLAAYPFERRWLQRLAWGVGLTALFMAQSKTAWLAFLLCSGSMLLVRHGPGWWRRVGDPLRPGFGMLSLLGFMLAVLSLTMVLMLGDLGTRASQFFNTPEGAQLASLTGRDRIWAVAYDEWLRHPVFGYGPDLWNATYRASIGMANATHGHNQFMDTLARTGSVGAVGLVLYALVLLTLSLRFASATGGLSLALFIALLLRAISEVPLMMFGYGTELIIHVLLLMVLAAAARDRRTAHPQQPSRPAPARPLPRSSRHDLASARSSR